MPDDFVIAPNPETDSSLPYLLRVPIQGRPILFKARETWPRTSKVYCHRSEAWPDEVEIVERVPVRSCVRRGAAIDLVLDDGRLVAVVARKSLDGFATAPALPPRTPTPSEIRQWALDTGVAVSDRGRVPVEVVRAFEVAHGR